MRTTSVLFLQEEPALYSGYFQDPQLVPGDRVYPEGGHNMIKYDLPIQLPEYLIMRS